MSTIKTLVQSQFSAAAERYVRSAGHAHGSDLQRMLQLAQPEPTARMLDIATGGGHTALAFAPLVQEVIATDLTEEMLTAAAAFVASQGVENIHFERADAEALPYEDASFDIVTSRIAPHHFPDPQRFVSEVARVLRPGGQFVLDDNMAPDDPELDAFFNTFEKWRDPSHVRAWTIAEWSDWLRAAGLTITQTDPLERKRYHFTEWVERLAMPHDQQLALDHWLQAASAHCRDFFQVEVSDGHVQSLCGTFAIILARRA